MDIVGRDYITEANNIVSLCEKGKYGNIYKVNGIVIIDKTFSTKNVGIDSFLDIASWARRPLCAGSRSGASAEGTA